MAKPRAALETATGTLETVSSVVRLVAGDGHGSGTARKAVAKCAKRHGPYKAGHSGIWTPKRSRGIELHGRAANHQQSQWYLDTEEIQSRLAPLSLAPVRLSQWYLDTEEIQR